MRTGAVNCEMVLKGQDADWELLLDSCDQVPGQTPEHHQTLKRGALTSSGSRYREGAEAWVANEKHQF